METPVEPKPVEAVVEEGSNQAFLPRAEIEKLTGEYDKDGFFVLPDGDFYDPNGYYFDPEGYDQYGGYYEGGIYVPGEEYKEEYWRKYYELYGHEDEFEYDMEDYFSEEEEEEEEGEEGDEVIDGYRYMAEVIATSNTTTATTAVASAEVEEESKHDQAVEEVIEAVKQMHVEQLTEQQRFKQELKEKVFVEDANRLLPIAQHINPAIEYVKKQNEGQKFVMMMKNIPVQAQEQHIIRLIIKRMKDQGFEVPSDVSTMATVRVAKDKDGHATGIAQIVSTNKQCIIEVIKLHKKIWIKSCLTTYLSGFAYDDIDDFEGGAHDDEIGQDHDYQVNKWCEENPDYELIVFRKRKRLQKQAAAALTAQHAPSGTATAHVPVPTAVEDEDTKVSKMVAATSKKYEAPTASVPPKKKKPDSDDEYGRETIDVSKQKKK